MFKTVGVFGKFQDASVEEPLKKLTQHLESKGTMFLSILTLLL